MVVASKARKDLDEVLTQTVTYRRFSDVVIDYATGEKEEVFEDFEIDAQCTLQNVDDRHVDLGLLTVGDVTAFLRHEYTEEVDGTEIDPILVPEKKDVLFFLGNKFRIQGVTPATSEGQGIIGFDITAVREDSDKPVSQ